VPLFCVDRGRIFPAAAKRIREEGNWIMPGACAIRMSLAFDWPGVFAAFARSLFEHAPASRIVGFQPSFASGMDSSRAT
jgi:hypothetical protein